MIDTTKKVTGVNVNGAAMTVGDLTTKTITSNGTYNAQTVDGVNGYSEVVVNVGSSTTLKDFLTARGNNADYLFYDQTFIDASNVAAALAFSDTEDCTSFKSTFSNCYYLTTIPLIDTSSATTMYGMFSSCWALTSLPQIDTSNVDSMSNMFASCTSLVTAPSLNMSHVSDTSYMFGGCSALTTVPNYDLSNVGSMYWMFSSCTSLQSVPTIDLSSCYNVAYMFADSGLTTEPTFTNIPATDIDISGLYSGCASLTSAVGNTSFVFSNASQLFNNCSSLTTVGAYDFSNVTNAWDAFYNCTSITSIGITGIRVDWDISSCELLSASALSTIISNLGDVATDGNPSTGSYDATFNMGSTNLAKLSQSDIDAATAKGWTLT